MARYTGPVCRLCRREGAKLFLKGDRCYSTKCAIDRRNFAPGSHGQNRRQKKVSEYGTQLREKQKARRIYGVLERQFSNYFDKAERAAGITGENLLRLLERRMDNVVYRLGLGASRKEARQLVRHGHFTLNGRRTNIPSALVKIGDVVAIDPGSKSLPRIKELVERSTERTPPEWLTYESDQGRATVAALPAREQIDAAVQEHLIVELYSR
ncbi:MAG TPA: 30S ribosomal protein S4 [Spirochaetia bacterium]|nr:30S ribosomal protein S4 [Spirochaetia bacterium]